MHAFCKAFRSCCGLSIRANIISIKNACERQGLAEETRARASVWRFTRQYESGAPGAVLNSRSARIRYHLISKSFRWSERGWSASVASPGFPRETHRALASALQISRMNWDWPKFRRQFFFHLFQRASVTAEPCASRCSRRNLRRTSLCLIIQPFVAFFDSVSVSPEQNCPAILHVQAELDFSLFQLPLQRSRCPRT